MAKKFMLEKYIKSQLTNTSDTTCNFPPIFQVNEYDNTPTFLDIMSENHTLVMHNSKLKYQNIKLKKDTTILQHKLKQKMLCDSMHWEIIEEIKFCEWLNDKQNLEDLTCKITKKTNKRKSNEGFMSHTHTKTQENKKAKVTVSKPTPTPPPTPYHKIEEKDVIVIYDSDDTDTDNDDDDNYNSKVGIIHFNSDSD